MEEDYKIVKIRMALTGRSYEVLTSVNTRQRLGYVDVEIPLFNLRTTASDSDEISVAVSEAVQSFCNDSVKQGIGVETQLKSLGIIL